MTPCRIWRRRNDAYTLVEMLIVVSILIMLVAVTLPIAKKVVDGSHSREASRQLNAYFAMAKARTLQTGRPCGLFFSFPTPPLGVIEPNLTTSAQFTAYWPVRHVTQLFLAEVPAPYSGSTTNSLAKISDPVGTPPLQRRLFLPLAASGAPETLPTDPETSILLSLINRGEIFLVRFNYKGEWYRCVRGLNGTALPNESAFYFIGDISTAPLPPFNATLPPGYNDTTVALTPGKPFQILRSPRPVGNALELPRGACIDMTYSGVGIAGRGFVTPLTTLNSMAANLAVMFSPNGDIDSLYINGFPADPPAASLYFLLGKVEKVPTDTTLTGLISPAQFANREISNLADPTSLWVAVSRGTGQIVTTENMPDPTTAPAGIAFYLRSARTAAILGEQMGGQ